MVGVYGVVVGIHITVRENYHSLLTDIERLPCAYLIHLLQDGAIEILLRVARLEIVVHDIVGNKEVFRHPLVLYKGNMQIGGREPLAHHLYCPFLCRDLVFGQRKVYEQQQAELAISQFLLPDIFDFHQLRLHVVVFIQV